MRKVGNGRFRAYLWKCLNPCHEMCGWPWCRRSSGGTRRAWAGGLRAQNLPCPAPPHTQTAYPTSSCFAHMKDKSPMYNLSKFYTRTYDSLREWSLATLAKMSRQNWLHAITILVTMRATVEISMFWWQRQFVMDVASHESNLIHVSYF